MTPGFSPRRLLAPLSLPYAVAVAARNAWYDRHPNAVTHAGVPTISLGNITVGGTGKTPLAIEIARRLLDRGRRPAILSRGYRRRSGEEADEVRELREALPAAPVVVDPDRVAGAAIARRAHGADCLVLDDGFQHRRLARDLDIVLIDALDPWGGGLVLPAGRLREPLRGLRRADLFVITRANQAPRDALERIEARLARLGAGPCCRADVQPLALRLVDGGPAPLEELGYSAVLPVCGLGNPATFLRLVDPLAGRLCRPLRYRDHHAYSDRDVRAIAAQAAARGADLVLTTRKDWVKLAPRWRPELLGDEAVRLARLDVRLVVHDDEGVLDAALSRVLG